MANGSFRFLKLLICNNQTKSTKYARAVIYYFIVWDWEQLEMQLLSSSTAAAAVVAKVLYAKKYMIFCNKSVSVSVVGR